MEPEDMHLKIGDEYIHVTDISFNNEPYIDEDEEEHECLHELSVEFELDSETLKKLLQPKTCEKCQHLIDIVECVNDETRFCGYGCTETKMEAFTMEETQRCFFYKKNSIKNDTL